MKLCRKLMLHGPSCVCAAFASRHNTGEGLLFIHMVKVSIRLVQECVFKLWCSPEVTH